MVSSVNGVQNAIFQLLGASTSSLSSSTQALSSGNRLTSASTDVAALSIATGLQTETSSLRQASQNIAQASSFLQVADGGLQQSSAILQRMQELAVQSNNGALSDSARAGLNTEFQQLTEELNRIAGNTSFNDVNLLDGSLSTNNDLTTNTSVGDQASGALTFSGNVNAGETITLNGITLTEGVDFNAGASVENTLDNLSDALNSDSRFDGFTFERQGNSLSITADAAGTAGNQFTIDTTASTATFAVTGDDLTGAGVFSLQGGTDAGLSSGDVQANGNINGNLLTGSFGTAASTQLQFTDASDIQAGDTIQIDDGEGGFTTFTFTNGAPTNNQEIQIGSSLEETLQNTANTINSFEGAGDFGTRQLTATVEGNNLVLTGNQTGNAVDVNGAALDINLGTTGGNITNTQLNNGTTGGIDASGVTNADFIGNIQGFEATFDGPDQATVSIEVGGETYTAEITDTTPGADTTVRFESENGGFFDVTLAAGQGLDVDSQADADAFAAQFDTAFSGVEFSQTQEISNFEGPGGIVGAALEITGNNLTGLEAEGVDVTSNANGNSSIEITINGETFRADNLGDSLGAGEEITLTSTSNANNSLTFTNGGAAVDLSSDSAAADLQSDLEDGLGIPGGQGAKFQIGSNADDVTNLTIGDVSADALFGGQDLDLLSAENASAALAAVQDAIGSVTAQRAEVGSFQSSLGFAAANVETAIQNQEAARAALEDTDIAEASTQFALDALNNQAQIATLAQSNRMEGNLLNLLVE